MSVEPYIRDGRRAFDTVARLHEAPAERRAHPVICVIVWAAISIGSIAMVYGALQFFLWALSSVGGPA